MINTTPCIVGLCHENEKYTLKKKQKKQVAISKIYFKIY